MLSQPGVECECGDDCTQLHASSRSCRVEMLESSIDLLVWLSAHLFVWPLEGRTGETHGIAIDGRIWRAILNGPIVRPL